MSRSEPLHRREFLRAALTLASGVFVAGRSMAGPPGAPIEDDVRLGFIGVGDRGGRQLLEWDFLPLQGVRIVAVADPFQSRREERAARVTEHYGDGEPCRPYLDFRDMLASEQLHGVVVATHDGWHVPAAAAAIRAGVDVYVEKPLGVTIEQDLRLRNLAHQHGAVFQYGTQQRSMAHCRHGCELVRNGRVGRIERIEVIAPQGYGGGSTEPLPVPSDLDYDLWLGPTPYSPYTSDRCVNRGSFFVYDNSIGFLGGWGAHPLDILDWAYGDEDRVPVEYRGEGFIPVTGLYDTVTTWEVHCRYADGTPMEFRSGVTDLTRFIGSEGSIDISRGGLAADPPELLESTIEPGEVRLPFSHHHAQNFVDGIRTRIAPVSDIDSAVRSDAISLLSDIAIRTGRTIRWNPQAEMIVADEAARRMMSRTPRPGWEW